MMPRTRYGPFSCWLNVPMLSRNRRIISWLPTAILIVRPWTMLNGIHGPGAIIQRECAVLFVYRCNRPVDCIVRCKRLIIPLSKIAPSADKHVMACLKTWQLVMELLAYLPFSKRCSSIFFPSTFTSRRGCLERCSMSTNSGWAYRTGGLKVLGAFNIPEINDGADFI